MRTSPLLAIVGETASGKSSMAMALAKRFNGELICADSWTVYKGFDIGTAKPSSEDQRRVRHHLLDVAEPEQGFSAVLFQKLAREVIADIEARNKLPILVGGTGLYIDSVIFSYEFLPPPSPQLRAELNALSLDEVVERANRLGLDLTSIDARNKRRVIRLIENNGQLPGKGPLRENTLILAIDTDRENLKERIAARVDAMLAAGLEDEVRQLSEKYGWNVEPMKGISYSEWQPYFAGVHDLEQTKQRIIKDTLDLAKRQRTWFKRNKAINYLCNTDEAVELTTTFLNKS